MHRRTVVGLLALACALALGAPAAHAATCTPTLEDSGGYDWDLAADGAVVDGENNAYQDYGFADVHGSGEATSGGGYPPAGADACGREDGDREIVYPPVADVGGTGVTVQRKVYVPAAGRAFGRWLDVLVNPRGEPLTVAYNWYGDYGRVDGVVADETGDGFIELGERFGAFRNAAGTSVASLWAGPGSPSWDRFYRDDPARVPGYDGSTRGDYLWSRVTLPPGRRVTFMHVEHQDNDPERAAAFARDVSGGQPELYAGMTAEELGSLLNWPHPDADADTVFFRFDTCPAVANADQADLDGDRSGDACDDDVDGDGLTNAQEAAIGSDPRAVDSDGDGLADGADACVTLRGAGRGCPPRDRANRLTPTRITLRVRKTRRPGRVTLRATGRAVLPAALTPAEACGAGVLLVTVKSGGTTVSTRIAELGEDCTYRSQVTFLRARLERIGARELTVRALFTGNDRLTRRGSSRVRAGRP